MVDFQVLLLVVMGPLTETSSMTHATSCTRFQSTLDHKHYIMSVSAVLNHTAKTQYKNIQTNFNNIVSGYAVTLLKCYGY
jgi:hypothetical protein